MTQATPSLVSLTELTDRFLGSVRITTVVERDPYINMLIYGDPGIGKTVLAGSSQAVPDMQPVLVIDIEGGVFSLRERYPDVEVVRVTSMREMQEVYAELKAGHTEYRTVVLDSLTEIQKFSMNQIMAEVVKNDPSRDPDVPSLREWGKNGEQTRRLVRGFRDLPMNAIFTALANSDRDVKTGVTKTKPQLSGKLASEVAGFMDFCLYMYAKEVTKGNETTLLRAALTSPTESYVCKDRSGKLPLVVEFPTMAKLHDIIHGKAETETQ